MYPGFDEVQLLGLLLCTGIWGGNWKRESIAVPA